MVVWALLLILLALSAVISGTETALFGLSRHDQEQIRSASPRHYQRVQAVLRDPTRCLSTVLLANVAVNVSIYTVSFVAMEGFRSLHPAAAAVASLGVLLSVLVIGEILPKGLALSATVKLAPWAATIVLVLQVVLAPFRWVLMTFLVNPISRLLTPATQTSGGVTTDELRLLVERSAQEGVIDSKENQMLQGVLGLTRTSVREVMTPRVDLLSISIDTNREKARRFLQSSNRRDVLVHGRDLDDLRGILFGRDLHLRSHATLTSLLRPIHYVPEQSNLLQLVRYFRNAEIETAVVVDEFGGTAGIVSVVDIAKRIVGDLPAYDTSRPLAVEQLDENRYRVPGDLSVRVWAERFRVGELDGRIDTVAGVILSRLGRVPQPGDSVRVANLTLTVETMEPRRIATVVLNRDPPESTADEEST